MSDNQEAAAGAGAGRTILAGSAVVFAAQMINTLLMILAQRAILSTLPKDANGDFYWVQRLVDLAIVVFVELGMAQVAGRMIIHQPQRADDIMGTFIKLRSMLWLLVSAATLGAMLIYKPGVFDLTLLTLLFYLVAGRTGVMRMVFETRRRSRTDLTLISALSVLDMLLFTILVIIDQPNLTPERVMLWMLIAALPGFVWMVLVSGDVKRIFSNFNLGITRQFLHECAPIFMASIFMQVAEKAEIFFFDLYSTSTETGIYGAASKVYLPFLVVVVSFTTGLYASVARFHKEDPERANRMIYRGLKVLLLLAVGLSMLTSAAAPWIIHFLTKDQYADNLVHFQLFPWTSFAVFVVHYVMFMHITIGTQRRNNWIAIALLISSAAAHIVFTSQFEALGAIVARIIANLITAGVALYTLRDVFNGERLRGLLLNVGALALISAAATWYGLQILPTAAAVLAALPIFVLFVVLTRAVDKQDVDLARSIFQGVLNKLGIKGGR